MSLVLRFHLGIGYPWTLNLFAAFSTLWLEREIRYYRSRPAPRLERMGEASYSLYLTHFSSAAIVRVLPNYSSLAPISVWLWSLASCATVAALFYRFIERPSHEFARHLKRWEPRLRHLNNTRLHRILSDLASQLPDRTQ
jgi:peptidoglycan/LPS O-acetylase OafA/YrhL